MTNKIVRAFQEGTINDYMRRRLHEATQKGMSDALIDELVADAQYASDLGVDNDEDYNAYFFIIRFADDILDDTFGMKVDPMRKKDLHHFMMKHRRGGEYKLDDLTDHRLLIHKWLCDRLSKKAYPNIAGKENREPIYDVDRWISALKNIYASLHAKKLDRQEAIDHFTLDWDSDEKQKFVNWMRYYEDGTTEKYNVKTAKFIKEAFEPAYSLPESWVSKEDRADDKMYMSTRQQNRERTRREEELHKANRFKNQMKARLRSFKRLVEKYNDILPKQDLDHIYDELYKLEKSVSKLDVYASIQDCIIRSANRMSKFGFDEGAEFLHKIAAEPEVGEDVMQSLPEGASKEPNLPPQSAQMTNVQSVINRLEAISKALKSRDMIRELASIDILLNEMGMASYFPELTDAQAKLIESFGYASNKVENIVAKLRGSGTSKPKEPVPPAAPVPALAVPPSPPAAKPIDTGELMSKPVGEVKKELPTE